jgi:hypothetical protein
MAIRKRTTKLLAKRHDLNYFKKGSPIRMWQWRLAVVSLVAAVVWIIASSVHSAQAFSSGPISSSHAVFGQKCETCHKPVIEGASFLPVGFGSARKVPDSACESCHTVGLHHANQTVATKQCSTCHIEHVGAMHLAAAPVAGCTQCHANLEVKNVPASIATNIQGFTKGHPDFRVLRTASPELREAAYGLKYNHAVHMKKDLTGPNNSKITLQCSYCHQVEDPAGKDSAHSGRMANVSFERSCQSCHSLDFSTKVKEQAPHAEAAKALAFVQTKMAEAAPGDKAALLKAETILFRGKCALCHTVSNINDLPGMALPTPNGGAPTFMSSTQARFVNASFDSSGSISTPMIAPSHAPQRFFSAALFSHTAHNTVQCEECHTQALTSVSGKDNLMPNIAVCQKCHDGQSRPQGPALSSGHAESGCSLCHEYHETLKVQLHTGTNDGHQPAFRIDQLSSK